MYYLCLSICEHTYTHTYINACIPIYIHTCIYMYAYTIYVHTSKYVCVYVCMHVCMHACMDVCMHACMYTHLFALFDQSHQVPEIQHFLSIALPNLCVCVCVCVFLVVCTPIHPLIHFCFSDSKKRSCFTKHILFNSAGWHLWKQVAPWL